MATRQATRTRLEDAAYIARRVGTDLRRLNRLYECMDESRLERYIHDIGVCLAENVLHGWTVYLAVSGQKIPEAYAYTATDGSNEASPHAGRFEYRADFVGASLHIQLHTSDDAGWDKLVAGGRLEGAWTTTPRVDLSHLSSRADGGYSRGVVGATRSKWI